MVKNKTTETQADVLAFIEKAAVSEQRRQDSLELIKIMQKVSGYPAKMWGSSIVGFGSYHYVYDSGHEGDAPLLGFSPRKGAISLYVFKALDEHMDLLKPLGKYKMGKACIYINKLSDINEAALEKIMESTLQYLNKKYGKN